MALRNALLGMSAHAGLRPILIAGPTAVGKSEVALILAERLKGEIVSVDSMQVYRGLNIGTAKPARADQARAPHHLIDILDLTDSYDAARFEQLASAAIAEIEVRERLPILCGGTGFYFKALLEGLGQAPASDPGLRAQLETTPLATLLAELAERDPVAYERIDRQNPRRIIRAIEVLRLTGRRFSDQQAPWSGVRASQFSSHIFFCLNRRTAELNQRIEARVDSMFQSGLVNETEELMKRGLAENRTASQALGYRQVIEYLQGKRTLADTVELVKIRTRQFAKRQLTWFRRQLSPTWIQLESGQSPNSVADILERHLIESLTVAQHAVKTVG